MAEYDDREHFIPLRKSDLIELLQSQPYLPSEHRDSFAQFCKLVVATYHFEYHDTLERLKDHYAPFDPDADTKLLREFTPEEKQEKIEELFKDFDFLLTKGNFKKLDKQAIDDALKESSDWGINMDIDMDVFAPGEGTDGKLLAIYYRGDIIGKRKAKKWWFWTVDKDVPIYQRLVLLFKLQPHKLLGDKVETDAIYVRIYKDIPKADLEMLFPGARPQMKWIDKGKIGVPLISGAGIVGYKLMVAGLIALMGKLLLEWSDLEAKHQHLTEVENALLAGGTGLLFLGFLGYAFRSYTSYINLKTKYALTLSESLYYQTLDGNAGTLFRLLDEAEEQECREAILGYYFLWLKAGRNGWTAEYLDDYIEEFLEKDAGILVDFEISDAIDKLERLRIVEKIAVRTKSGKREIRYRAQPMEKALEMLDWTWDNYFKYNNPEPEEPPIPAQKG